MKKGNKILKKLADPNFLVVMTVTLIVGLFLLFFVVRKPISKIFYNNGIDDYSAHDYDLAVKNLDTALKFYKKDTNYYSALANALNATNDHEKALKILDSGIERFAGAEELYILKVKTYILSGKVSDAIAFLDGIRDQYVAKKLDALRPKPLSYTPAPGSYDKSQTVTFTQREGETIYYTTDGTEPTLFSNEYKSPITVGKGKTTITAFSINDDGLISNVVKLNFTINSSNQIVDFADKNIEVLVRKALSKTFGNIYEKELEAVTVLDNNVYSYEITTLSDLSLMNNLEEVCLAGESKITDFSPLSSKTKLKKLDISGCGVTTSDLNSISSLTSLEELNLSNNNITDITNLSKLKSLKTLYLSYNKIDDLKPLENMKDLTSLWLKSNKLTNIKGIDKLTNISSLDISSNSLTEISTIHRLTNLKLLNLSSNPLQNVKNIESLTGLETVDVSGCQISNLDFASKLKNLKSLVASNNAITRINGISSLKLNELVLSSNNLYDISPVSNMTTLTFLDLSKNKFSTVHDLKNLKNLTYLNISSCPITSVADLKNLKNLATLKCTDTSVTDFKIIERTGLTITK